MIGKLVRRVRGFALVDKPRVESVTRLFQLLIPTDSVADVVFIHGLDGNYKKTWGFDAEENWLTWLAPRFPKLAFWSLGYEVASSAWLGNAMPLYQRAGNVLAVFEVNRLGARPVVFIAHSMGGLLVKELLRQARDLAIGHERIWANTKGIYFLSTPHTGSDLASLVHYLSFFLSGTVAIQELRPHGERLRELNTWYRNTAANAFKTRMLYEEHLTRGITVVSRESGDAGMPNVPAYGVDHNHHSIARPLIGDDVVVGQAALFLEECLGGSLTQSDEQKVASEIIRSKIKAKDDNEFAEAQAVAEHQAKRFPGSKAIIKALRFGTNVLPNSLSRVLIAAITAFSALYSAAALVRLIRTLLGLD